jgi:hypothetical protein
VVWVCGSYEQGHANAVLAEFKPYQVLYAGMLAEVGQLVQALKYCKAATEGLKHFKGAAGAPHLKHALSHAMQVSRAHAHCVVSRPLTPTVLLSSFLSIWSASHLGC